MDLIHILLLAIIQGVTEFLPISSSGHLILVSDLTDLPDQGLAIDVALHVGTLAAVVSYFWRESWMLARGSLDTARQRATSDARLFLHLVVATVPVVIAGFLLFGLIEGAWRNAHLVAIMTIVFGLVLYAADRTGGQMRTMVDMPLRHALIIGLAQVLALVPGTSRSGITMTAARALGYARTEAARFSLLLSIPTTMAAGTLGGYALVRSGDGAMQADALVAAILAFISAWIAIGGMMVWLRRQTFTPFVIYRLVLGLVLLAWLHFG